MDVPRNGCGTRRETRAGLKFCFPVPTLGGEGQHMQYRVFASLAEESNSGWVWLWKTDKLKSRTIVKIVHDGRNVFCECRAIDGNFLN